MRNKVVILTGCVNESVTTLELKPGELLRCRNYYEVDGAYGGYASASPYEVFDGSELASEIPATLLSTDPDTQEETWDDVDREARRAAITPIPGSGPALGVHIYNKKVFGARTDVAGSSASVYQATNTGWSLLTGITLNLGGHFRWVNARFSKYPTAPVATDYPPVTTNTVCMFFVDGVSQPYSWDGYTARVIDHGSLPSNASFTPAPVYPTHVGFYENRLFLAYPGGHLFFCALGDPSDWAAANGAGSIPLGGEVTNIVNGPGNTLVVFLEEGIRIIKRVYTDETGDFGFQMEELSVRSGAIADTAIRMFGDIYYTDDRGPTRLATTDEFGDFQESILTEKTQRTFEARRSLVSTAVVSRDQNQYRLFFNDGTAVYYTLSRGRVKGAGILRLEKAIVAAAEGRMAGNSTEIYFIADEDTGFVYKLDSGTSFNGEEIEAFFTTSYYHYASPRAWKHFSSLVFEVTADNGTRFNILTDYDYRDQTLPRNAFQDTSLAGLGGIWGDAVWGSFVWGGAYIQRPTFYVYGYGTTMSVTVRTVEKYRTPHIVHNFIADFTVHDRRI
jgi:hypothetical protein